MRLTGGYYMLVSDYYLCLTTKSVAYYQVKCCLLLLGYDAKLYLSVAISVGSSLKHEDLVCVLDLLALGSCSRSRYYNVKH